MALNFPNPPLTVGATYSSGGSTWVWDGTKWEAAGTTGVAVTVGATPPTGVQNGTLWFDTVSGQLFCFFNDGNSSQWVVANSGAVAGATGPTGPAGPTGATGPAASAVAAGGNPNIVLNGNCEIDQRNEGNSIGSMTAGGGNQIIDAFIAQYSAASGGVGVAGQASGGTYAATNFGFQKALSLWCGTAQASVGAGDFALLRHHIEANDIVDWPIGVTNSGIVTLSFLAHALGPYTQVPYTFNVIMGNSSLLRCYPLEFTITAQNVWQQFSAQIPLDQAGTWTTSGNGIGAILLFTAGVGSNNLGTVNTWNNQQTLGTSRNTNTLMLNANARISITGIKLEKGNIATPFMREPFQVQLARAQRRYEKSYDSGTVPGSAVPTPQLTAIGNNNTASGANIFVPVFYRITKRVASTITFWDAAGTAGRTTNYSGGWTNGNTPSGLQIGRTNGFVMAAGANNTAGYVSFDWVADSAL